MVNFFYKNLYYLCNYYADFNGKILLCEIPDKINNLSDNDLCLIILSEHLIPDSYTSFSLYGYTYDELSNNDFSNMKSELDNHYQISGNTYTSVIDDSYIIEIDYNDCVWGERRKKGVELLNHLLSNYVLIDNVYHNYEPVPYEENYAGHKEIIDFCKNINYKNTYDFYNSLGFISVLDPKYVKFTKPIHDKVEGHNDYFKTPSEWLNNWLWEGDIMKYLGFHNKNNTDSVFKKIR